MARIASDDGNPQRGKESGQVRVGFRGVRSGKSFGKESFRGLVNPSKEAHTASYPEPGSPRYAGEGDFLPQFSERPVLQCSHGSRAFAQDLGHLVHIQVAQ